MSNLRKKQRNQIIRDYRVLEAAIKAKCYDCMLSKKFDCEIPSCPLFRCRPWAKQQSIKD